MKLKLDDQGNAVLQDGHPVYTHPDGTESPFDVKAAHVKIGTLTREAAEKRTALKDATDKLSAFSGIEDPAAAVKALAFAESMDGKKAMDDEAIAKVVAAAVKPLQDKIAAQEQAATDLSTELYTERVSKQFASSPFINEKTLLTPDIAEARFGSHFTVEDGKFIAKDADGEQIYSTVKAGEPANFEEAITALVDAYPRKDDILRASGANGSGSQQNNAQHNNQEPTTSVQKIEAGLAELSK
jgi:hypothetical protein